METEEKVVFIREAAEDDFEWVTNLMHQALDPYYGGDHKAHAQRIFSAHIGGGRDKIGFFSFEQRMFIAELNNERVGMIHLVGKRQSTYKISPLIIIPKFQGQFGLGGKLLEYAEQYAYSKNSRQIYCTVAEKNLAAMQFFIKKGFIKAGSSDSHYKKDMTETMLYKPFFSSETGAVVDELNVSVLPFTDRYKEQVAEILLRNLPFSFEGIDKQWVDALFDGYHRSKYSTDINSKYKLIYIAVDGNDKVIDISAATPKKGNPIKLMPFIATNYVAFEAMLMDLPYQLSVFGHKLYVHLNPNVNEISSLQRLGWKLDAILPSAYRSDIATHQWSLNLGEKMMRTMRVKKHFFNLIRIGKKKLEVRVGYDTINRIQIGERICLSTHDSSFDVRVKNIRRYETFEKMLSSEDFKLIAPDCLTKHEALTLLKRIYPLEKESLGVVVFEFETLK